MTYDNVLVKFRMGTVLNISNNMAHLDFKTRLFSSYL
jgi:hypothetical protein